MASSVATRYAAGETIANIATDLSVSSWKIKDRLSREGVTVRRRGPKRNYTLNEHFFDTVETESQAYWLGFLLADGSVLQTGAGNWMLRVELQQRDRGHLEKLLVDLASDAPITSDECRKSAYVQICSVKLCASLKQLGCVPNKTRGYTPTRIQNHLQKHFYRGMTDGDGSLAESKGQYRFELLGPPKVCEACQTFLRDNLQLGRTKIAPRGDCVSAVRYGGNVQVKKISELLYADATVFLARKMDIYRRFCAGTLAALQENTDVGVI